MKRIIISAMKGAVYALMISIFAIIHQSEILAESKGIGKEGGRTIQALAEGYFNGMNAGDYFGYSVSNAGDVNGDGYDDVIIGAYGYSSNKGRAYIFFGGAIVDHSADVLLTGATAGDYFGISVSYAGDVNGDGYDDVIVGAYGYSSYTGKAYIFYGGSAMNTTADVTLTGENTGDYFGASVSNADDVNGDGYDDVIVGASGYVSNTGRAYIFYGGATMNTTADVTSTGESAGDYFGISVSNAGDVSGDGYDDVIVGAYSNNGNTGKAYIYYGGAAMDNTADVTMTGEATNDYYGYSVSSAGDVNGDGYADVIVGAYGNDTNGADAGRAYLYNGGSTMDNASDLTITGEAANNNFGSAVSSAGDVNGDGYDDIIVGAYGYDSNTGKTYVFFGGSSMDNIPDIMNDGKTTGDYFGESVSVVGDMNGDGYDDFIVGARLNDTNGADAGRAYLYRNSLTGSDIADLFLDGAATNDIAGESVANAGDVNGDGYDDVIVGAWGANSSLGRAYIYYGGNSMDNTADVTLSGEASVGYFGYSVSSAGDVNGDGYDDVIVGAYASNLPTGTDIGKAYIYYGGSSMDNTADVTMTGESANDYFGGTVSSAGDVNGDGYDDVIVGAHQYNSNTGRAYLYYGGSSMNNVADVTMDGAAVDDDFGLSAAGCGDVNGDGYNDYIIGSPYSNGYTGTAYLYYGGASLSGSVGLTLDGKNTNTHFASSISSGDVNGDGYPDIIIGVDSDGPGKVYIYYGGSVVDNSEDVTLTGEVTGDVFGGSVSSGDVNGDGYYDVIVGARSNAFVGVNTGRAYVFFGGSSMNSVVDIVMTGAASNDQFGVSVSTAGDFNYDGYSDVIIGSPRHDAAGNDAGRAYLYLSSAPSIKPRAVSAKDVPNDEGGYIKFKWVRSGYDGEGIAGISSYEIQRSAPPAKAGYVWETIAATTPREELFYLKTVTTWGDSSSSASGTAYYRVLAIGTNGEVWTSNIISGHSVDNLAPSAVKNLSNTSGAGGVVLTWNHNTESDLYNYQIYKSSAGTLDPDTATVYAATTDSTYTDVNPVKATVNYFVRAVDIHGNPGSLSATGANVVLTTNIKVLLEGANAGSGTMTTFLNGGGYIPLTQPYSGAPWYYPGTESVTSIPSGVVDWVLIELRSTPTLIDETRAAFLKNDGTLVDLDGTSPVDFPNSSAGNYYVVIKHRNHLSVMT
ncbi:MAG: hypothetical protein GXO87_15200 [Chlorobi bacterium]|nr:hypothetical protein [Chlorobiota bacterium]